MVFAREGAQREKRKEQWERGKGDVPLLDVLFRSLLVFLHTSGISSFYDVSTNE